MKTPRRFVLPLAVVGIFALSAVGLASNARTPSRYKTSLNLREEVPAAKNAPRRADGKFTAKLDGNVLSWTLSFSHLSGAATAAHIHAGVKGKAGPVIVPLCGPCKSPWNGKTKLTAAVIKQLADGKTYVNVHTARNPAGEIRGQIR